MSAPKTVINEVDGFFIMHNYRTMTLDTLSKKLKVKKETIRAYIDKNIDTKTSVEVKPADAPGRSYDLMARNKERGATIMTPAAAQVNDEYRAHEGAARPLDTSGYVHKIRG